VSRAKVSLIDLKSPVNRLGLGSGTEDAEKSKRKKEWREAHGALLQVTNECGVIQTQAARKY
jgi:hypothetical protein